MTENFPKFYRIVDGYVYNFYDSYTEEIRDQMVAYAQMAKNFMNRPFNSPLDVVGNYSWHQAFPYEEHLGWYGVNDESFGSKSVLDDGKVIRQLMKPDPFHIIDFGCGPGRMVERAENYFGNAVIDGVDISEYAIAYAREHRKGKFYISSGIDVGDAPENYYDLVYSTIAMQHIPVKTIRMNILKGMYNLLRTNGMISLQVAYSPDQEAGVWSPDTEHASYESDFWNAKATNGHADCVVNEKSLPLLINDLCDIFNDVEYELVDVKSKYANLKGNYHAPYWATDWLFVKGTK